MGTLLQKAGTVSIGDGRFLIRLPNGVAFSFPIAGNRRFERATPEQLVHVEVDGEGLHWPGIDEDLSFAGLLRGDWGQYVRDEDTREEPGVEPSAWHGELLAERRRRAATGEEKFLPWEEATKLLAKELP